jgi:pimeloyl-ACP methyl ester carboxylesterase
MKLIGLFKYHLNTMRCKAPEKDMLFSVPLFASILIAVFLLTSCATGKSVSDLVTSPAYANPGLFSFELVDLNWHDRARDRAVPARLYWPKVASGQQVPLIIFSHGIGGSRSGYSYLGKYWANHGYASLHLQHVGSDRSLWRGDVFSIIPRLQNAANDNEAIQRVHDLSFALDQLLASEYGVFINQNRIVAAGHSYGANTVMLAAGANLARSGKNIQLRDTRISAAIILSAPPFYGEDDFVPILAGVRIPTLHITCTEDTINIPGYVSPPSDRIKVFDAMGSSLKILTVFQDGSHSVFTDRAGTGGILLNAQIKAATQTLSLAFLRRIFDGANEATLTWGNENQPLVSQFIIIEK